MSGPADPHDFRLRRRLSSLIKQGRWTEAQAVQAKHLETYPNDAASLHRMGRILAERGDLAGALTHVRRAHDLMPEEASYLSTLARLYTLLNDRTNAVAFRKKAQALRPVQQKGFETNQATARRKALEEIAAALKLCLPSWTYAKSADVNINSAEALLASHQLDQVPLWTRFIPLKHASGEIAELTHVGRFMIGDTNQTLHKRLARGMPWELPAAALFVELAKRCDPRALMIDIGANIGAHTVPLARSFPGTVLAFEPVPVTYSHLMQNLALNGIGNCVALQKACSASPGLGRMVRVIENNPGKAQLDTSASDGVEVTTLDQEIARLGRPVAFIKVDVEGHEQEVFDGAMETIRRDRPIIFCEILGEARAAAMEKKFASSGYTLRHFHQQDWLLIPGPPPVRT